MAGERGFFALAPDLYCQEPTTQPDEARQRMMALSMDRAEKDMIAAGEHLVALHGVEGEHVGALRFCLGGGLAVWAAAATQLSGSTGSCYNVIPHCKQDFSKITGQLIKLLELHRIHAESAYERATHTRSARRLTASEGRAIYAEQLTDLKRGSAQKTRLRASRLGMTGAPA